MPTYDLIRELPVEIEGHELKGLEFPYSPEFVRVTTQIELHGGGEVGVGEDVTYDGLDHVAFQAEGGSLPLAGSYTLESFFAKLDELDLWPSPPVREPSILYRRWAFESAALDLALRQAGRSLADVLGREARPVNFVVSMRLSAPGQEGPETAERLLSLLERYPGTRFKLDPTNSWTQELVDELGGHRRRGHARPEGLLPRHARGRGHRPGAVPDGRGGVPRRLDRGSRRDRRDAADPRRASATA